MPNIDQLVLALRANRPPPHPPAIPVPLRRRHHAGVLAAVAIAAAVVLSVVVPEPTPVTQRGPTPSTVAHAPELRMLVMRGGIAVRIGDGGSGHVGEQVYFRAQGEPDRMLQLTVEGPEGRAVLWEGEGTEGEIDVGSANGLLAYVFGLPGLYRFTLGDGREAVSAVSIQVQQ